MASPLEPVSFQCHLPPILTPQAVDEGRRRAHDLDAFNPLAEETRREFFRRLPRRGCRAGVVCVGPRDDRKVGEGRKRECFACRQLGRIEALVVPDGRAPKAVVLGVACLDDDPRLPPVAPRPARGLHYQREGVLRRSIVREVEW